MKSATTAVKMECPNFTIHRFFSKLFTDFFFKAFHRHVTFESGFEFTIEEKQQLHDK